MARADILISLVQSVGHGDMVSFRRAVESLIAEERAKSHNILAERLATSLNNGNGGRNGITTRSNNGGHNDLIFEVVPQKNFEDLILDNKSVIIKHLNNSNLIPSFLLYSNSPGTGKTSTAKIIANTLGCDFILINASDERGVDIIREKIKWQK